MGASGFHRARTYRMRLLLNIGLGGLAAGLLLGQGAQTAHAATATSTIAVTATVLSFCSLTALPLAFGNYSTALVNATTTLAVLCTVGTTYNVGLDLGQGSGATVSQRKMTYNTSVLGYGLYADAAHSIAWGSTVGSNTQTGTGTGLTQTLTVYGQIPANQVVAPGLYTDTVTATITY